MWVVYLVVIQFYRVNHYTVKRKPNLLYFGIIQCTFIVFFYVSDASLIPHNVFDSITVIYSFTVACTSVIHSIDSSP